MFRAIARLTKHSVVYGTGYVLSRALMLFLLPVHTNFLSKAEYGIVTELYAFMAVGAIIYSLGLNTAELQFYITIPDIKSRKVFFSTAFKTTLMWSAVLFLLTFIGRATLSHIFFHDSSYSNLVLITSVIIILDIISLLGYNIYRAEQKPAVFAIIHLINVLVNVGFTFLFVVKNRMGVSGVFLSNLIASGISFGFLLPVMLKLLIKGFDLKALKRMLRFGLPFVPSILAIVFVNVIDRFFITNMLGLDAAGVYGAGYKLGMAINLIVIGFSYAWHPFYLSVAKDPKAKELFSAVLTYFLLICSGVFLLISFYAEDLVRLRIAGITFFGRDFWQATKVVPVVMLSYIAYGSVLIFQVGIYVKEKTKYLVLVSGTGALLNIAGNLILIKLMGIMGAAVSTFFSFATMAILSYIVSSKFLKIIYEFKRILHLCVVACFIYFAYGFTESYLSSFAGVTLFVLYYIVLFLTKFFSARERSKVKQIVARLWQG